MNQKTKWLRNIISRARCLDYDQFYNHVGHEYDSESDVFTDWQQMQKDFSLFFLSLPEGRAERLLQLLGGDL